MFTDFVNDCKATRLAQGLGPRAHVNGVKANKTNNYSSKLPLKSAPELTVSA